MIRRLVLLAALLLAPAPAAAQTFTGTLTWTHTRPADLSSYTLAVDGGTATSLGLPATNSAAVTLATGSHTLVLNACYTDATCVASAPITVSATANTPITYTVLQPATPFSIAAGPAANPGIACKVTASDNSGIALVKLHWIFNGSDNTGFTAVQSPTGTWTSTALATSGPGTRTWYFEIRSVDGQTVTTPVRTVVVTP